MLMVGFARSNNGAMFVLLPLLLWLYMCAMMVRGWEMRSTIGRHSHSRPSSSPGRRGEAMLLFSTDPYYFSALEEAPLLGSDGPIGSRITLTRYLDDVVKENPEMQDMVSLLDAVKMACKTISNLVHRAGLVQSPSDFVSTTTTTTPLETRSSNTGGDFSDGRYYSMQRLDLLSTIVLKNALKYTGKCEVAEPLDQDKEVAQHQPGVLIAKSIDSNYVACLDPLDGSGNADASICTGTVFGVFEGTIPSREDFDRDHSQLDERQRTKQFLTSVLQPGKNMKAAGYCLYSSATVLVFSLGTHGSVQGFTLDPQLQEFVLTHANLTIPARGTVYSVNEANSANGWDPGFLKYLWALKTGTGLSQKRYAHRYVGSMVGDIHRTLLYGGLFAYPSDKVLHPHGNLQLLYKIAPMAFVVEKAGGMAISETGQSLLELSPERIHQKSPCFLGSPQDVQELQTYLEENK